MFSCLLLAQKVLKNIYIYITRIMEYSKVSGRIGVHKQKSVSALILQ